MDIRLVRGRNQRLWAWITGIVALALVAWGSAFVFGDATRQPGKQVGAKANFGAEREAVVPVEAEPFAAALPLEERELGRLLHLTGTAESEMRSNAVWVRTVGGRRILVRFEPAPPPGAVRLYAGSAVDVNGYLQKISRAELEAWVQDTLRVYLPRPKPGVKFGDLPDSGFARVDSLFIRRFYISVRPEGVRGSRAPAPGVVLPGGPAAPPRPARGTPQPNAAVTRPEIPGATGTGPGAGAGDTSRPATPPPSEPAAPDSTPPPGGAGR